MTAGDEEARVGREYPQAPIVGVAAVVLRSAEILLIRRGREPMLGAWSLPGGAVSHGENPRDTVVREIAAETGLSVAVDDLQDVSADLRRSLRSKFPQLFPKH